MVSKIVFPFPGDTIGGSHLAAIKLIEHLPPDRYRTTVVVHEDGPLTAHLRDRGIEYETISPPPPYVGAALNKRGQIRHLVQTTASIRQYLRNSDAQIVHTNDARMHMSWAVPSRLSGVALVLHQRTKHSPSTLRRGLARLANQIVGVSNYVIDSLPAEQRRRARRVYDPFAATRLPITRLQAQDAIRAEIAAPSDARIIGFSGTLNDQKRPRVFLEAGRILCDRCDFPVRLVLFGADRTGAEVELRDHAAELGITDCAHFLGFRDPFAQWLMGMDVLLAPGVNEAFGNAIVEATLIGVPVVAAHSGGNPEIITGPNHGLLAEPDSPDAFAQAAIQILNNSGVAGTTDAGDQERRFSIESHCQEIMQIYDDLIGRAAR